MSKTWYGHHIDTIKGNDYVLFKDYLELDKTIEEKDKEIENLKKDLINLLRIIDKNCDDLEGTEEEFDSLDRAEDLLKALKEGKQ